MHVDALNLHPLKSAAIRPVDTAEVGPFGLVGDREWMVVDGDLELLSARECHELFRVVADCPQTGAAADLVLRHPDASPLEVSRPADGEPLSVTLFGRQPLPARAAGTIADRWLRRVLHRDGIRLVWCAEPEARILNPAYFDWSEHATFPDGAPISVVTAESVTALRRASDEAARQQGSAPTAYDERRFRQNIVVGDAEPFAEDGWERVRIGDVTLRCAGQIARCVMTTIDPDTIATGKEPIATLARERKRDGKTWLGRQLIAETSGTIRVGDPVEVD